MNKYNGECCKVMHIDCVHFVINYDASAWI